MSRIHEALKKAAQERSAQLAASGQPAFLEVADAPRTIVPLPELDEVALRTHVPMEAPSYLRYEDLVKRCASPRWNIDPRMSGFEGGDEGSVGAHVSNRRISATEARGGDEQRASGRKNFCRSESSAVDCKATRSQSAVD